MDQGTDLAAGDQPNRHPNCPPWCTRHDWDSNIHLGDVHAVPLDREERGIALQLEQVLRDCVDPAHPALIHLQQRAGRDGVSLLPDEADRLAGMLPKLVAQARATQQPQHPIWCDQDQPHDEGQHRGRVMHVDLTDYALAAGLYAWDDRPGEVPPPELWHVELEIRSTAFYGEGTWMRVALSVSETRQLVELLQSRIADAERWCTP